MPPQDVSDRQPLHPIREGVGFVMAALGALAAVFWPAHRRRRPGQPESRADGRSAGDPPGQSGAFPIKD